MTEEYLFDLGEDGNFVVVPSETTESKNSDSGLLDASIESAISNTVRTIVENPKTILTAPLKGIAKLFLGGIPPIDDKNFQMEEFTVEFALDGSTEAGVDNPVVTAKVIPSGNFKCSYKWSRKKKGSEGH